MNQELINWSLKKYSDLPWRKNRSLYHTLVSEIMLQQTTVSTVLNHFERFVRKFPTIHELAKLTEEEILIEWKGLGYYRRARNLLKIAKMIETKFAGEIPKQYETLIQIDGIGPYTANALIAMGTDKPALALDANLERVLSRYYGVKELKGPKLQEKLKKMFEESKIATEINILGARNLNEALMDLGRVRCRANEADCDLCPLGGDCVARNNEPLSYPLKKEQSSQKYYELDLLRVIVQKDGKYLAYKKSASEWLSGQFEIPTFCFFSEDKQIKQYPKLETEDYFHFLPSIKTSITKYKINNFFIYLSYEELVKSKIVSDIENYRLIEKKLLSTASQKGIHFFYEN